ncbi:MAG TPA: PQQ-dependent sugar dehydrogenase, partial [Thermomicrobiales bacterium]|nr:PQQ-dependent sugar dehydrogenase [Thermomicrobiales bacterium]
MLRAFIAIVASVGLLAPVAMAQDATTTPTTFDPSAFNVGFEQIGSGFSKPVFITNAGDDSGRLFVVDQVGQIQIIQDGDVLPTPFLDIVPLVNSSSQELGLLGLAFAPDYATSGYFYVDYITQDMHTVVVRYSVSKDDANVADPDSAVTI